MPQSGLDAAVSRAVKECIREGILSDFLRQNRAEVEKVSIFEYDKEEEERKLREAEYEGGWDAGMRAGMKTGIEQSAAVMVRMAREAHMEEDKITEILRDELKLDEQMIKKLLK